MSDGERLAAAICLALFLHFSLLFIQPGEDVPAPALRIEIVPETASPAAPKTTPGTGISSAEPRDGEENARRDRKRRAYLDYLEAVDSAIHARRLAEGGKALIGTALCAFAIHKDGTFSEPAVIKTSGDRALDAASLAAVRSASGMVRRPKILGDGDLHVSLWIKFQYALE